MKVIYELIARSYFSWLIVLGLLTVSSVSAVTGEQKHHVFQEKAKKDPSIVSLYRPNKLVVHEVIFAISQSNIEKLIHVLDDVSDPYSNNYGKHWSKSQIAEFTANTKAYNTVMAYLHSKQDVVIDRQSLYREYVFAKAPVHVWEDVFATTFHTYEISIGEYRENRNVQVIRTEEYSLPVELDGYVSTVLNTVQFHGENAVRKRYKHDHVPKSALKPQKNSFDKRAFLSEKMDPVESSESLASYSTPTPQPSSLYKVGSVTPKLLTNYYSISSTIANSPVSQAVYETDGQGYSPSDLTMFQQTFGLQQQSPKVNQYGSLSYNCPRGYCKEGNLDVQYIMGIAQNVETTYDYELTDQYDFLTNWIISVSNTATPANVYSISWGSVENLMSSSFAYTFNVEAIKLGVMGTTILAASGDDGVLPHMARGNSTYCEYSPLFPASSPYVVAVGGTNGPQSKQPEVACQSGRWSNSSLISSGGGFSNMYTQPSWQTQVVGDYLALVKGTSKQPSTSSKFRSGVNLGSYNSYGRAYPDVSLLAHNYKVVVNGSIVLIDGTSASVTVMAAFVSLVNAQRKGKGKSLMGYMNPFLYKYYANFTNDITSGDNKCSAAINLGTSASPYYEREVTCCAEGFYATKGWDPVTGLGSVNFDKFLSTAMRVANDDYYFSLSSSIVFIIIIVVILVIVGLCFLVACVVGLFHVTCIAGVLFLACAACIRCFTNGNSNRGVSVATGPSLPAAQYSSVIVVDVESITPCGRQTADAYDAVPTYSIECIEVGDLNAKNESRTRNDSALGRDVHNQLNNTGVAGAYQYSPATITRARDEETLV